MKVLRTIAGAMLACSASSVLQPSVLEEVNRISLLQRATPLVIADIRLVWTVVGRATILPKPKFSYIAGQLQRQAQSVSESIVRVEAWCGAALFEGTATKRSARPTVTGLALQSKFARLIGTWDDIQADVLVLAPELRNRPKAKREAR